MCFNYANNKLLTGSDGGKARIYNIYSSSLSSSPKVLYEEHTNVELVEFSSDDSIILVLKRHVYLYLYNSSNYTLKRTYSSLGNNNLCGTLNSTMNRLIVGTFDSSTLWLYPTNSN